MSEKFYVVSESELVDLFNAGPYEEAKAEAACRMRPVELVEANPGDVIYVPLEV